MTPSMEEEMSTDAEMSDADGLDTGNVIGVDTGMTTGPKGEATDWAGTLGIGKCKGFPKWRLRKPPADDINALFEEDVKFVVDSCARDAGRVFEEKAPGENSGFAGIPAIDIADAAAIFSSRLLAPAIVLVAF